MQKFDVVISGAGPAGAACAIALSDSGLRVALVDKATFPRDKICGDALSVDVVNQLPMLSRELADEFLQLSCKVDVPGIRIVSPGGHKVDLPFLYHGEPKSGYVARRMDFDHLLVKHAQQVPEVTFLENCQVQSARSDSKGVKVRTSKGDLNAEMMVAADGAHSIFTRMLGNKLDRRHHSAGMRVYYSNVDAMHTESFIELIFFKEVLPGYVWIFPLPDGRANVGIGVLSSRVKARQINLRKLLSGLMKHHPRLRDRFAQAIPEEKMQGFGLPLGSVKRKISGERILLTGDAAGLIDPFSGEGIGNALRSGRKAAWQIRRSFEAHDFSDSFIHEYSNEVYTAMRKEFQVSRSLQNACKYPRLFDWIARKASDPYWHAYLMDSLTDMHKKNRLTDPLLYLKMMVK